MILMVSNSGRMLLLASLVTASLAVMGVNASEPTPESPAGRVPTRAHTGGIEGTVTYVADPVDPWRYARYYVKDREGGQLAEAVVALAVSAPSETDVSKEPSVTIIDQKNFQFMPETVAIRAGDQVKFTNSDKEVHNVQAFHPLHQFNVNMPSRGEHVETFTQAGGLRRPYRIRCVYHSAMRAWVFVFDHSYFQVTEADGRFRLTDVPPGDYTLGAVHAAGEMQWSKSIRVNPGQKTRMDIFLSPKDKLKAGR